MLTLRSGLLRCAAAALALVAGNTPLSAQATSGSIAGQITDSASKTPLAGARIQIVGTQLVATTRAEGRFTIRAVPAGQYEVRVLAVGYSSARAKVTVTAGGIAEANVAMVPVAYSLDDLVYTATGEQRRLELGHTVGTIKADSIATYSPISDLADLLQGRTAGVNILQSSGTSGTGTRIRIRGANSVSLSNEPLIFIDGVRANQGTSSSSLGTGGQAPSRLNDLNPEEIENIEIIKGPSAATLYGTEAANGVIRITTKRGTTGDTRWNFWLEQGRITDPNPYFDNYRAKGRALTNGVPGASVVTCLLVSRAAGTCVQDSVTTYNPLRTPGVTPIGVGGRRQYGASVTGGTNQVQYFVSGEYEGEDGTFELPNAEERRLKLARNVTELPENVLRPNALTKVSFRTNVNANVAANTDLQASIGYVSSDLRLPQNDNNSLGMLPSGYFGRASAADTAGTGGGWGFFRPGEIFSLLRNQNVERFTGSAQGTTRPASWLNARASVGYDITNRTDISFDPTQQGPAFGTTPLGAKTDTRVQLRTYTVDLGATASTDLRRNIKSKTSIGVQYFRDVFFSNTANGQRLPFGSSDIDGAAILTASQTTSKTVTLGAYIEQQLNIGEKLFLTGALRADDNSSFGTDFDAIIFPKASVSYLLSEESWFPKGAISLFRLRSAWGASGLQPGATDALYFFSPTSAAIGNQAASAVTFGGIGLPNLKPEKSRELEAGFDLNLWNDRVSVEATYYNKRTSDALIARVLAPSLGVAGSRLENLGSVSNEGVELVVNARIIDKPSLGWDVTVAASGNKNRLRELGEGIPPIIFGLGTNTQRHQEGYTLGGYWARPYSFNDANGDGVIGITEVTVADSFNFLGPSIPTREASLNQTITLANGRIRLGSQVDYRGGHLLFNSTEEFRCTATGNNCRGLHDPTASLDEQARAVARRFTSAATPEGFFEPGWFVRLREVSLTWDAPQKVARALGGSRLAVTLAGRNLGVLTDYTGVDPELNGAGQSNFNSFDFLTQPQVRSWIMRVNIGF